MENYIINTYNPSDFLVEFMKNMGLMNKTTLLHFMSPQFQSSIVTHFIKHVNKFLKFHEYFGFEEHPTEQEFRVKYENAKDIEDILKPGDLVLLQIMSNDMNTVNEKKVVRNQETERKTMLMKLLNTAKQVYKSVGQYELANRAEVSMEYVKGKLKPLIYCKVANCGVAVTTTLQKKKYFVNSNFSRHLYKRHKLTIQKKSKKNT